VVDFAAGGASRWTRSEPDLPAAQTTVAAQPLRFQTWDRINGSYRQLPAWIYRPASPGPHPVLILLSGGNGQPRNRYDPLLQYLVNEQGYAVILPTLRGSGGFGRSFAALIAGELRDDAARDVGSLLVWIGLQPDLDRSRIAIQGNGATAYTALASLTQYGDRLRRAIVVDGAPELTRPPAGGKSVLVMRGFETPLSTMPVAEQLLWRLRSAGTDTALLAVAGEAAVAGSAARVQAMRAVAQFLAPLADLRAPRDPPALPTPAEVSP
jgi:pimeloyl-ACP methyl ester carboxylesterase